MRTTLTLDDDLNQKLHELATRKRMSFKAVVNATLRKGLKVNGNNQEKPQRITLPRFELSYRNGIDEVKLKEHLEDLCTEDFDAR